MDDGSSRLLLHCRSQASITSTTPAPHSTRRTTRRRRQQQLLRAAVLPHTQRRTRIQPAPPNLAKPGPDPQCVSRPVSALFGVDARSEWHCQWPASASVRRDALCSPLQLACLLARHCLLVVVALSQARALTRARSLRADITIFPSNFPTGGVNKAAHKSNGRNYLFFKNPLRDSSEYTEARSAEGVGQLAAWRDARRHCDGCAFPRPTTSSPPHPLAATPACANALAQCPFSASSSSSSSS